MVAPTLSPGGLGKSTTSKPSNNANGQPPSAALIERSEMVDLLANSALLRHGRRWGSVFIACACAGVIGLLGGVAFLVLGIVGDDHPRRLLFFVVGNCTLGASILWLVCTTLIAYHRRRGAASQTLRQLSMAEVDEAVLLGLVEHLASGPFRLHRDRLVALLERCKLEAELQAMEEGELDLKANRQAAGIAVLSVGEVPILPSPCTPKA